MHPDGGTRGGKKGEKGEREMEGGGLQPTRYIPGYPKNIDKGRFFIALAGVDSMKETRHTLK